MSVYAPGDLVCFFKERERESVNATQLYFDCNAILSSLNILITINYSGYQLLCYVTLLRSTRIRPVPVAVMGG